MAKEKTEKTIKEKLAEINEKITDLYNVGGTQSLFNAVNGIVDDKSIYQQKMDFLLKVLANENSTPQIVLDIAKVQEIKLKLNKTGKIKKDDLMVLNTIYRRLK